jgi:NADPH:quinone reductase-like Zn-dependent oxidoreductase
LKAVRLHEYGGPEKLIYEDNVPEPALTDEGVLVELTSTSVNPIDWKIRSGARQKDFPLKLPAILGKDICGVVGAVGKDIRTFKAGDRVIGMGEATYAERVVIAGSVLTHIPDGVDLIDAAAIPLVVLTGDQLVRLAAQVQRGQTVIVSGALGSVGRAAVHAAIKLGARVIAGVRKRQLAEAASLGAAEVLAVDDDEAIAKLANVDSVADTVGNETASRLLGKVKPGGRFGYASMLLEGAAAAHSQVKITRVFAKPDPSKVREFADDVRDGKFILPIGRRMPLRDAAEAQNIAQKGGIGKVILLTR